jgi:hypothetical protein
MVVIAFLKGIDQTVSSYNKTSRIRDNTLDFETMTYRTVGNLTFKRPFSLT